MNLSSLWNHFMIILPFSNPGRITEWLFVYCAMKFGHA
jgi:hypothetical protein